MEPLVAALREPTVLALAAAGYFAGSIPFGLILALVFARKDVRKAGSGNIGATNVARVVGKKLGVVTLVFDAAKGAIPVLVAAHLVGDMLVPGLVGLAALLGHCFPIWLKFKGGKGVATGLGVVLALRPEAAAVGLVFFIVAYATVRLVSAGSLIAAAAVLAFLAIRGPYDVTLAPLALCFVIIFAKHHGNIRRLLTRKELKV